MSAVTTGTTFWLGAVNRRTRFALRAEDLKRAFEAELGGADTLSTAQTALVRRAAMLEARLELDDVALVSGNAIDEGKHEKRVYMLCRVLKDLFPGGMDRSAKLINDSFDHFLELAAEQEALDEALS